MSSKSVGLPGSRLTLLALAIVLGGCQIAENLTARFFRSSERSGRMVQGKQEGEWVYRYPDGDPKAKGAYANDKQIGHWIYWYENGNVEWEGEFDESRLSGPSRFGYENGKNRAVGLFVAGLEEDLWTFWNQDGQIDCEGDFVGGEPALRWSYYHLDGTLQAEGFRLHGEKAGPWQFYTPAGEMSERRFPLPQGVQIVHETWDGVVPRREGFLVDGVQSGRWVSYHPNGRRRMTCDFVGGVPRGLCIGWTRPSANGSSGGPTWPRSCPGNASISRRRSTAHGRGRTRRLREPRRRSSASGWQRLPLPRGRSST
jgi:antitoxin component YwqK of YwqJK toxin-antitoxin module